MNLEPVLAGVIALVEQEGRALSEEFLLPGGPRGADSKAPIDTEIELRLRAGLQALLPCAFVGEETGAFPGTPSDTLRDWVWLIDPHDGTTEFLKARRGSAISVGLVHEGIAVLGVVHSPHSPDRGPDLISWAEGCGPLRRNGEPVDVPLYGRTLNPRERVWLTAAASLRPQTYSRGVSPARYVCMPSIAYRLARVAAGDGVAALTIHPVHEYDIAAGAALVRGAGGVLLDKEGRDIVFSGLENARVTGCYAGAPEAARVLAQFDWQSMKNEQKRPLRVPPVFPALVDAQNLSRAQACLLGLVIGDSLASLVAHGSAQQVANTFPDGVRELADGGAWGTLAGQPAAAGELAIALARSLAREGGFEPNAARIAYQHWIASDCFEAAPELQAVLSASLPGSDRSPRLLARAAVIGISASGQASRAATAAREDANLTRADAAGAHACAAFAAAVSEGVGGGSRDSMARAALDALDAQAAGVRDVLEQAMSGEPAEAELMSRSPVLAGLHNAFRQLAGGGGFEEGLVASVGLGAACTAVAGALLGASLGMRAVPGRWTLPVLACRPLAEADAFRPRPIDYWPDDVLDLAEGLLRRPA